MAAAEKLTLGARVKGLREQEGYSLEELAEECGQSVDFLQKLEEDQVVPPVALLLTLGRVLDVDSGTLLKDEDQNENDEVRATAVKKRTEHYSYELLSQDDEHKHMRAFRVRIEPEKNLEGPGYQHQGEEFIYVVQGSISVKVGDEKHHLGTGQSLHFNSNLVHIFKNEGQLEAELIVVLYTP